MNKHILKYLLALVPMAFITACEVDEYNSEHFDGYNPDMEFADVQTFKHTLTDEEYAKIANNRINKKLAENNNLSDELKRVASDKAFSDKILAKDYLPAFLQEDFAYHLSNGSSVVITYNSLRTEYPETVTGVSGAKEYKLANTDYEKAWAEDGISAAYFTPAKPAERFIPEILKNTQANAQEGDYVIASYKFSEQEPAIGGGEGEGNGGGETPSAYTPINKLSVGQDVTVKATVLACNNGGMVIADGDTDKDRVFVFLGASASYAVGDVITVAGTVGERGGLQFSNAEIAFVEKNANFKAPAAVAMTGEEFQNYGSTPTVKYAELTGKYTFSGKYHNFEVEGSSIKGSIPFANLGLVNETLNNKTLKVKAYVYSYSGRDGQVSYINMMVTDVLSIDGAAAENVSTVAEAMAAADATMVKVQGQLAAVSGNIYVLNDCTGNIYVRPASFDASLKVGDVVSVEGEIDDYHKVNKIDKANVTKLNTADMSFKPAAPRALTGADLDAYIENSACLYATYTGKLVISGHYYNVMVDDAVTAQGSLKDMAEGLIPADMDQKNVVVTGYLTGVSGGKFINTVVLDIKEASAASLALFSTRAAAVTTSRFAAYKFNGSAWQADDEVIMVNPADYEQMGSSHANFSTSFKPETYIPTFLTLKYPYAQPDFTITVGYHFYANKETSLRADVYTYNGTEWANQSGDKVENSAPFNKKDGKWVYDPSMVIELGTQEAEDLADEYFNMCIDYIVKNKPQYKEDYNGKIETERYGGCSIYKHNLDWRIGKTITAWQKAGEDISAFEKYKEGSAEEKAAAHAAFYEKIEHQFAELMQIAVNTKHADVKMIDGIETIYTFNIKIYIGRTVKSATHAFRFKLVADGQFEYMDMKPLSDEFDFANPANFQM